MTYGAPTEVAQEDPAAGPDTIARGTVDQRVWTYHDKWHEGPYSLCQACTDVWHFLTFEHVNPATTRRP